MGWLLNILGAPVVGPLKMTKWIGEKIREAADQEFGGQDKFKAELIELQMKLEMEEISQEEYNKNEKDILERMKALKKVEGT